MSTHASIAIFHNSAEYTEGESTPIVPDKVFEAAKRIAIAKSGTEVVRTRDGLYFVEYAESGPFKDGTHPDWLPVYVARILKWHSGGIKNSEIETFEDDDTPIP